MQAEAAPFRPAQASGEASYLQNFPRSFYITAHPTSNKPFTLQPSTLHSHIESTMLQRTILRASRQAARRTPAFAPLRQPVGVTRVAATPAIRWYSDAAPAKEGEAAEKKEDAPSDEASKLKEQVEKKDKEIVELKVCPMSNSR